MLMQQHTTPHQRTHTDAHLGGGEQETFEKAKLFYAQRNVYLTGSVLFLFFVLSRFCGAMVELMKMEEKAEVLKQQAARTSSEYMKRTWASGGGGLRNLPATQLLIIRNHPHPRHSAGQGPGV
jgi:hypothetical protein